MQSCILVEFCYYDLQWKRPKVFVSIKYFEAQCLYVKFIIEITIGLNIEYKLKYMNTKD